tara:strand:+ start:138 stop:716 length:579 start_codon:yes stop_codon:yes gene_type:complete
MATIDSLDLATLTNNPQSIAEALEDVLETTSGNIGSLKTSAQNDHDAIEDLRTSAQNDHDAIETLLSNTNTEEYHITTGFSNGYSAYSWHSTSTDDEGVRIRKMGALYLVDIAIIKEQGVGYFYDVTVMNVGNNITKPSNTVKLGMGFYGYADDDNVFFTPKLDTNGDLKLSGYSADATNTIIFASFMGIDV